MSRDRGAVLTESRARFPRNAFLGPPAPPGGPGTVRAVGGQRSKRLINASRGALSLIGASAAPRRLVTERVKSRAGECVCVCVFSASAAAPRAGEPPRRAWPSITPAPRAEVERPALSVFEAPHCAATRSRRPLQRSRLRAPRQIGFPPPPLPPVSDGGTRLPSRSRHGPAAALSDGAKCRHVRLSSPGWGFSQFNYFSGPGGRGELLLLRPVVFNCLPPRLTPAMTLFPSSSAHTSPCVLFGRTHNSPAPVDLSAYPFTAEHLCILLLTRSQTLVYPSPYPKLPLLLIHPRKQ
ncbi:hypothetical protein AAFF_G00141250 [Aldrovandia affinis]|uniref:Uncharacterized protein n=1 Tax=Aldrovandia affinis TaxID=143900 RepID=A0AAD7TDV0_9TELE|nr:hypothetical protein AAFF_G00141250 [Aldrovandia affinis]